MGRETGGGSRGRGSMYTYSWFRASLVAQLVKRLPATQENRVRFLGWEDPLEKEMATHSSILAWRIPWTEEPGRLVHRIANSWTWLSNWHWMLIYVYPCIYGDHCQLLRWAYNFKSGKTLSKISLPNPSNLRQHKLSSLVAQLVKNLPAMQETRVWFLGWEGPLEKRMAIHFSILACRIPWTEEPGRLQSMGSQELDTWLSN